jgi:hypothetical protein
VTRSVRRLSALVVVLTMVALSAPLMAQWVVYDPTNYAQAVAQYEQLLQQYEFLIQQARRLPIDLGARYHADSLAWTSYDPSGLLYARTLLAALNAGDATGTGYRDTVQPLDVPTDVAAHMPADMQRRLTTGYSTLELSDNVARLAVDQTGRARANGPLTQQAINHVDQDGGNPADDFHAQTALLEKINAALTLALRISEETNQLQLSLVEHAIVDNKRKRDAEATLMNGTIRQWRYGQSYGSDLFRHTAANIDGWRPY